MYINDFPVGDRVVNNWQKPAIYQKGDEVRARWMFNLIKMKFNNV